MKDAGEHGSCPLHPNQLKEPARISQAFECRHGEDGVCVLYDLYDLIEQEMMGGFLHQFARGRAPELGKRIRTGRAVMSLCGGLLLWTSFAGAQDLLPGGSWPAVLQAGQSSAAVANPQTKENSAGLTTTVWEWKGLRVDKIEFEGVTFDKTDTLPNELAQKVGAPLDPQKVRESIRRLFASGRYRDISVRGIKQGGGVTLIFAGPARYYVGRVTIEGVKNDRLMSLLEFATKLSPGAAFTDAEIPAGTEGIKQMLQQQGYYEPSDLGKDDDGPCGRTDRRNVYGCDWAAGADWPGGGGRHRYRA